MSAAQIVMGALAGLALGVTVALINGVFTRRAVAKGTSAAMAAAMGCRMALDVALLAGIYLLRNVIPLPFEPTLIGAALGLSLGGIVSAAAISRQLNGKKKNEE